MGASAHMSGLLSSRSSILRDLCTIIIRPLLLLPLITVNASDTHWNAAFEFHPSLNVVATVATSSGRKLTGELD